jgi:RNA dependent RNA polymerase
MKGVNRPPPSRTSLGLHEAKQPVRTSLGPSMIGSGTPTRGDGHTEINDIVNDLNHRFDLGLPIRLEPVSPIKVPSNDQNQCYDLIKRCYWATRPQLIQTLDRYAIQVPHIPDAGRIPYLVRLLKEILPQLQTRSGSRGIRDGALKTPATGKTPATSFVERLTAQPNTSSVPVPDPRSSNGHMPVPEAAPVADAPPPTVFEEDEFLTPPQSPTIAALSSIYHSSPSRSHVPRSRGPDSNESLSAKKRRSEEPSPRFPSPKYRKMSGSRHSGSTTITTEYQSADENPFGFQLEPTQPAPSQETVPSAQTSFASTIPPDQPPKSANTSFTSIESGPEPLPPIHGPKKEEDRTSTSCSIAASTLDSDSLDRLLKRSEFAPEPLAPMGEPEKEEKRTSMSARIAVSTLDSYSVDRLLKRPEFASREHCQEFHSSGTLSWDTETQSEFLNLVQEAERKVKTPTKPLESLDLGKSQGKQNLNLPEHHRVRDFPHSGLFFGEGGNLVANFQFRVRYECARAALHNSISLDEALPHAGDRILDYEAMWLHIQSLARISPSFEVPRRGDAAAWRAARGDFDGVNLNGALTWSKSATGHLFNLTLEPFEKDKSCRFQRAFGGDRFLYLKVPWLNRLPASLKGQQPNFQRRFQEWLLKEKRFLRRIWRCVHLEAYKPKKTGRRVRVDKEFQYRIVLFAVSGCDIHPKMAPPPSSDPYEYYSSKGETSVEELVKWFMPVSETAEQNFCKAFARFDLGFSRTTPTIVFRPYQVRKGLDIRADGTPESTEFDDPSLDWTEVRKPNYDRVMNDGCSRISLGACREIWKKMGWDTQHHIRS